MDALYSITRCYREATMQKYCFLYMLIHFLCFFCFKKSLIGSLISFKLGK